MAAGARTETTDTDKPGAPRRLAGGLRRVGVCLTEAPTSVRGYVRQQVRWNKSFYREALWSLRYLAWRRSPYLLLELMLQILLPFCLLAAIGTISAAAFAGDPNRLVRYVALIIPIGLLRAAYGLLRTGDRRFWFFPLYGFLHVLVLIPVRLYALATIRNEGWGTRGTSSCRRSRLPEWLPAVSRFAPGVALLTLVTVSLSWAGAVSTPHADSTRSRSQASDVRRVLPRTPAGPRWPQSPHLSTAPAFASYELGDEAGVHHHALWRGDLPRSPDKASNR